MREQFALVQRLEALGYDSVWTGDHVSFHNPIYESLTLLAYAAGRDMPKDDAKAFAYFEQIADSQADISPSSPIAR